MAHFSQLIYGHWLLFAHCVYLLLSTTLALAEKGKLEGSDQAQESEIVTYSRVTFEGPLSLWEDLRQKGVLKGGKIDMQKYDWSAKQTIIHSLGVLPPMIGKARGSPYVWCFCVIMIQVCLVRVGFFYIGGGDLQEPDDYDDDDRPISPAVYARFSTKKRVRLFLRDAASGPRAFSFSIFMSCSICLSLLAMNLESELELQRAIPRIFDMLEWFFLLTFSMEMLGLWMASATPLAHFYHYNTWIDICAVLPSYTDIFLHQGGDVELFKLLRMIRIFRLFRLGKLAETSTNLRMIIRGFQNAQPAMGIAFLMIGFTVYVPGVVMYFVEQGNYDAELDCHRRETEFGGELEEGCSPFRNIPLACYWAFATVTTVGYGDAVPFSRVGKAVACCTMYFGVICLACPIGMISTAFSNAQDAINEEEKQSQLKIQKMIQIANEAYLNAMSAQFNASSAEVVSGRNDPEAHMGRNYSEADSGQSKRKPPEQKDPKPSLCSEEVELRTMRKAVSTPSEKEAPQNRVLHKF